MRAEYVNAFLVPSVRVLEKMARVSVRLGRPRRLEGLELGDNLCIIIGLQGRLNGSVVLAASHAVAWAVAERIAGGAVEDDREVRAILAELANTIVGNATGHLYDLGVREGITPPTVVDGEAVNVDFGTGMEIVLLPLETEAGRVDLVVSLAPEEP
ncbi:chemotaxis protein CheX [Deferrisoma camini]|uniref:chemotaxis protein CheX n=1 Tax=Deferrisoma camini TaxID=1035120 RepID=UPI00046D6DC7|nr:chemotaxis protein CheX [Deferrisoma camini]NOY44546.1 chemotaxis protein CheX [Deltaproteobacteria bacterium]